MINKVDVGIDFVGYIVKPERMMLRQKTVNKAFHKISEWQRNKNRFLTETLLDFMRTMNSYLGMMQHLSAYKARQSIGSLVRCLFIHPDEYFSKLVVA